MTLTRSEALVVAAKAQVDPRTVRKYVERGGVRGMPAERIAAALKELGFEGGTRNAGAAVPDGAGGTPRDGGAGKGLGS